MAKQWKLSADGMPQRPARPRRPDAPEVPATLGGSYLASTAGLGTTSPPPKLRGRARYGKGASFRGWEAQ